MNLSICLSVCIRISTGEKVLKCYWLGIKENTQGLINDFIKHIPLSDSQTYFSDPLAFLRPFKEHFTPVTFQYSSYTS